MYIMFDVQEEEEEESDDEDDAFGPKKNKEEEDEDPVARKFGGRLGKSPESKVGFTENSKTTMYVIPSHRSIFFDSRIYKKILPSHYWSNCFVSLLC